MGNGKWEMEDRKSIKDLPKCHRKLKTHRFFSENPPRIRQKSSHYRLEGENPSKIRRKSVPNPSCNGNSGKHKLFSMPREPAQPDHRGRGGVEEGSGRGQGGVEEGSGKVKADDYAPRPTPYQERDINKRPWT